MMLSPDESRDLARRMNNLGRALSLEQREMIPRVAETKGYEAALVLFPDVGDRGDIPVVTIETAAHIMGEVVQGNMTFDIALKTLRSAAMEGL